MEIKKIGKLKTDVIVDISKNDVISFLYDQLGVPHMDLTHERFYEHLFVKKDENGFPIGIYKEVKHFRNVGRGEEKFDYSEDILISDDKSKASLCDAYLRIVNALRNSEKIS